MLLLESRVVEVEGTVSHEAVPHLGAVLVVVGHAEASELLFFDHGVLVPVDFLSVRLRSFRRSLAQTLVEGVVELLLENLVLSLLL